MRGTRSSGRQAKANRASLIQKLLDVSMYDLLQALGKEFPSQQRVAPSLSKNEGVRLFLSYARSDRPLVEKVFEQLERAGFTPWMDVRNIRPGERWRFAIEGAISQADFFLLFVSPNSVNRRGFLQREIRMAIDKTQELLDDDIYFLPIRLMDCPLPRQLTDFQAVDLFKPGGYKLLLAALKEGHARRTKKGEKGE